jgi:hypothetical protein
MQKGVINMEQSWEKKEFVSGLKLRLAVVQVKPGESTEEAWYRHLKEKPDAILATLKIFNQPAP